MVVVNREEILAKLEAVQSGTTPKEIIQQSNSIAFKNQTAYTFNDEIACSYEIGIDITGAVRANELIEILRKLPEEEVEISVRGTELLIKGKGRKAFVAMDADITLPLDFIDPPAEWKKLHPDFCDALSIVWPCAGQDDKKFHFTCVHIHPGWLEASDDVQLTRYRLNTGFAASAFVRRDTIKSIVQFGMTEFSETENWVHFKNPSGLVMSCRRYLVEYPDLTKFLKVDGTPLKLPRALLEAIDRAEIFCTDEANPKTMVKLQEGKIFIKASGPGGRYSEGRRLNYEGSPLSFYIDPGLLSELIKRNSQCLVTLDHIKIDGGVWRFVACLTRTEKEGVD